MYRFNHIGALTIMDMGSNSTNLYIDVAGDLWYRNPAGTTVKLN